MKIKFLPKETNISVDILIYRNKIALISFDNLYGIVIQNKEISECMIQIHKVLWNTL